MMTLDEAIRLMRCDPSYVQLVEDAYLGADVRECAERYWLSAEFQEVVKLLNGHIVGGRVMDLGAGTGIASFAFWRTGASKVYAIEPDPSDEVGTGAIRRLSLGPRVRIISARGEELPLPDGAIDVVYLRAVLHHAQDLRALVRDCARVLKSGGVFLASREHVIDDAGQLRRFLANHPVHRLAGGENAFPLEAYLSAIRQAGLKVDRILGPWDTVINAYPTVRTADELKLLPKTVLQRRLGRLGRVLGGIPGVTIAVSNWLRRPVPGRLYSFFASKP